MIKTIIIDDVKQARDTLKRDIHSYCPGIEVAGEAGSVIEGAKIIKTIQPDLVFLDIHMRDGTGFDLLEIVQPLTFKLIFTTGSDAHAIKAFKFSALDYLLKPIDPDELMEAVKKIDKESKTSPDSVDLLRDNINNTGEKIKKLALNTLDKIHITNISDIIRCESNVNYTLFYFANGKKLMVTKTLKEYEKILKDYGFVRVHQSHLINSNFLIEFVKSEGGYLVMSDNSQVPVSTRKKQQVLEMIDKL